MAKRNLYLNNMPVDEAKEKYLSYLQAKCETEEETVKVKDSLGRVSAHPIYAKRNSPLYDSAAMDGIAVVSNHTNGASETMPVSLVPEEDFLVVDTGDPIRPPYDAVIMAEDLIELSEGQVEIRAAASAWQHVRPIGEDIVQGEMILPGKHEIRPFDIGVMLSGGIVEIPVLKQPSIGVIPTGTELIEPGTEPKEGDIIESNSRMFEALIMEAGCIGVRYAPVPDDYERLKKTIIEAVDSHEMVLINAGSSAGTEDYTVHILREIGTVVVHGVAMKPGKPVILAEVSGKPVIGLPGYPVSAYLAYHTFAAPVIGMLSGKREEKNQVVPATITRRLVSSLKHREYVRVKVGGVGGKLVATPLARGAGAAMSLVRADGFCIIDQNSEGAMAGETVNVELIRKLTELSSMVVCIGSHDLILDIINDHMVNRLDGTSLSSSHVGSMGGLLALQKGEAHMAPVHILDEETGVYNIPIIKKIFPGEPMALIKGVGRTQGIMVKKGNPKDIRGIANLSGVRYVNRQRGAGTRILFDYLLEKSNISATEIRGYDREAATHMAVAAAVAGENADAGMGILSSAEAMGLDFIPVGEEEYDFAIPERFLGLPQIKSFIEVLKSDEFQRQVEKLGGYTLGQLGEVVLING